jgi:hypothetical protein
MGRPGCFDSKFQAHTPNNLNPECPGIIFSTIHSSTLDSPNVGEFLQTRAPETADEDLAQVLLDNAFVWNYASYHRTKLGPVRHVTKSKIKIRAIIDS